MVKTAGFTHTVKEPMVKESDVKGEGGLRVDWIVRGFWEHQREALFDCRIFNVDAISYVNTSIDTLLEKHTNENDVVLDSFGGSGTTAVASLKVNRGYILIERDEKYYNISLDRVKQIEDKMIYNKV
jgi:DNA modification methylase